jgi:hypothetical protein
MREAGLGTDFKPLVCHPSKGWTSSRINDDRQISEEISARPAQKRKNHLSCMGVMRKSQEQTDRLFPPLPGRAILKGPVAGKIPAIGQT